MRAVLGLVAVWARGPTDLPPNAGQAIAATALPNVSFTLDGMNRFLSKKTGEQYRKFAHIQGMIPMALLDLSSVEVKRLTEAADVKEYTEDPVAQVLTDTTLEPQKYGAGRAVSFTHVAQELKALTQWGSAFVKGAHTGLDVMPGQAHPFTSINDEFAPAKVAAAGPPKGMKQTDWWKTLAARRVKAVTTRLHHDIVAASAEVNDELQAAKKIAKVAAPCPDEEDFCAESAFADIEVPLKRVAESGAYVMRKFTPKRLADGIKHGKQLLAVPLGLKDTFHLQQMALLKALNLTKFSLTQLWEQGDVPTSFLKTSSDQINTAFGKMIAKSVKFSAVAETSVVSMDQGQMPQHSSLLRAYGEFCDTIAQSMDEIRAAFGLDEVGDNDQVSKKVEQYLGQAASYATGLAVDAKKAKGHLADVLKKNLLGYKKWADHSASTFDHLARQTKLQDFTPGWLKTRPQPKPAALDEEEAETVPEAESLEQTSGEQYEAAKTPYGPGDTI